MEQTFNIQGYTVKVSRDNQEKAFVSRQLRFIDEVDATFYLPKADGTFIYHAEEGLLYLAEHYANLKALSFAAIGAEALKGGYWGKKLADNPQLDLVRVKVLSPPDEEELQLELAFNDAVRDAYTLWITSFEGLELKGTQRQAW